MDTIILDVKADAGVIINPAANSKAKLGGFFTYECFDKNGKLKWGGVSHNAITYQGLRYLLDIMFGGVTPESAWYIGIYTAYVGSVLDLTGMDIGGPNLTEFTAYTGTRKLYTGVRSGQTWDNALNKAQFPITNNGTIKGAFLCSDDAGTANYLFALDAFASGDRAVAPGDTLNVGYAITFANV